MNDLKFVDGLVIGLWIGIGLYALDWYMRREFVRAYNLGRIEAMNEGQVEQ